LVCVVENHGFDPFLVLGLEPDSVGPTLDPKCENHPFRHCKTATADECKSRMASLLQNCVQNPPPFHPQSHKQNAPPPTCERSPFSPSRESTRKESRTPLESGQTDPLKFAHPPARVRPRPAPRDPPAAKNHVAPSVNPFALLRIMDLLHFAVPRRQALPPFHPRDKTRPRCPPCERSPPLPSPRRKREQERRGGAEGGSNNAPRDAPGRGEGGTPHWVWNERRGGGPGVCGWHLTQPRQISDL
jgi:hypothetical protein